MQQTDIELKSIAYDNLVQIEQCQNNLKFISNELASRAKNTQTNKTMENEEVKVESVVETTPEVEEVVE